MLEYWDSRSAVDRPYWNKKELRQSLYKMVHNFEYDTTEAGFHVRVGRIAPSLERDAIGHTDDVPR